MEEAMSVDDSRICTNSSVSDLVVSGLKDISWNPPTDMVNDTLNGKICEIIEIKPIELEGADMWDVQTAYSDTDKDSDENICSLPDNSLNPECNPIPSITEVNSVECENCGVIPETEVMKQVVIQVKREPEVTTNDIQGYSYMVDSATDLECQASVDHRFDAVIQENSGVIKLEDHSMVIQKDETWQVQKVQETFANGHDMDMEESQSDLGATQGSDRLIEMPPTFSRDTEDVKKPFKCTLCWKTFRSQTWLSRHIEVHRKRNNRLFACDECGEVFIRFKLLIEHKRKLHWMTVTCYKCEICGKKCYTRRQFYNHLRTHECEKKLGNIDDYIKQYPVSSPGYSSYLCPEIVVKKEMATDVDNMTQDYSRTNDLEPQSSIDVNPRSSASTGDVVTYPCACGRLFASQSILAEHMRKHITHSVGACDVCGKSFKFQKSLIKHKKQHTNERSKTSTISSGNVTKSHVPVYERRDALVRKTFMCTVCGMFHGNQSSLTRHLKQHKRYRYQMFTCHCGKVFMRRAQLHQHEKQAHTLYNCIICGEKYTKPAKLKAHLKTHNTNFENLTAGNGAAASHSLCDDSNEEIWNHKASDMTECTARVASISYGNCIEEGVETPCNDVCETEVCEIKSEVRTNADITERELELETGVIHMQNAVAGTAQSDVAYLSSCETDLKKCMAIPRMETCKIKIEEVPVYVGSTEGNLQLDTMDTSVINLQVSEGISTTYSREVKPEVTRDRNVEINEEETTTELRKMEQIHLSHFDAVNAKVDHNPPKCYLCGRNFRKQSTLTAHMKRHIQAEKACEKIPVKCKRCGKTFSKHWALNEHKKHHRRTRNPVKCNLCGVTFINQHKLTTHMKRHSQPKYTCDECGEKFPTLIPMLEHKKTSHPKIGKKERFACGICEMKCKKQSGLDKHREEHEFVDRHITEGIKKTYCTLFRVPKTNYSCSKMLYSCHFCPFICVLQARMRQHFADRHKNMHG